MSGEPGIENGVPGDQIAAKFAAAKDSFARKDINPAREVMATASLAICEKIEKGDLPNDPLKAWQLERVKIAKGKVAEGVRYFLKPPQKILDETGIVMAYIEIKENNLNKIGVLYASSHANPYGERIDPDIRTIDYGVNDRTLEDITRVYTDIAGHGIVRREEGVLCDRRSDHGEFSPSFEEFVNELNFSGKLPVSSKKDLSGQALAAQVEVDARKAAARSQTLIPRPSLRSEPREADDPSDPVVRAKALGLKRNYGGGEIYFEKDIAEALAGPIIAGFEGQTFPDSTDQSYSLTQLRIAPDINGYSASVTPSYRLSPPPGSDLPPIYVSPSGVRISIDETRALDMETYPHEKGGKNAFLKNVLDAYEYLKAYGIKISEDLRVSLRLSEQEGGGEEALAKLAEQFSHSAALIPEEVRRDMLGQRAAIVAERARKAAEAQAKQERVWAEAQARKEEEEGHDFLDGLSKYAAKREGEKNDPTIDPLAASLTASAQKLMWTFQDGHVIPGILLDEKNRALAKRLIGPSSDWDTNPRYILAKLERTLTSEFLEVVQDKGKAAIKINPAYFSGRFERSGPEANPNDLGMGAEREYSVERQKDGSLVIHPDAETTFTDLNVTLAPELPVDAELLDRNGRPTGRTITAEPILRARLTEKVSGKSKKQTTLYRTREGLVVICPDGTANCYPDDLLSQAHITRKPVIYLYPTKSTDVTVNLDYAGTLTNTYPQITGDTWQVTAAPDSTLKIKGKKYKYLFWDGINGEVDWDWSKGFCIHKADIDTFLEEKIEQLGLNFAEAQDFITYWAPMMKQNEWSLVSFQTERYEELAKLMIDPKPDTLIRLFIVFKKSDKKIVIDEQKIVKIKRKGFTVVEWGGSNLDELQILN